VAFPRLLKNISAFYLVDIILFCRNDKKDYKPEESFSDENPARKQAPLSLNIKNKCNSRKICHFRTKFSIHYVGNA